MDFSLSPRVEDLRDRIAAFMAEHVEPVEEEALRALDDGVRPDIAYPRVLVDLRERAKAEGLWTCSWPSRAARLPSVSQEISEIKVVAANVFMDVLDRAIQVHGALGHLRRPAARADVAPGPVAAPRRRPRRGPQDGHRPARARRG
jgi:alkylation response protein AidB-like acyl-CoA dehydrogenase